MNKNESMKEIVSTDEKLSISKRAWRSGYRLRKEIGEPEDTDKKLKSLIYQLVNAINSGSRDIFFDILIRLYTGANLPIPKIIGEISNSQDDFKEIGYSFLLGLKYSAFNKENKNKEKNNEK